MINNTLARSTIIGEVFVVGIVLIVCAMIISFFLSEIPFRKTQKPSLEETGEKLSQECGKSLSSPEPIFS